MLYVYSLVLLVYYDDGSLQSKTLLERDNDRPAGGPHWSIVVKDVVT